MKLEVGMYVRKVNGNIEKITGVQDVKYTTGIQRYFSCSEPEECFSTEDDITKASHNIIDLIEVGDYVNGYKLLYQDSHYSYFDIDTCDWIYIKKDEQIKSIVTKEQFESMEYNVNE